MRIPPVRSAIILIVTVISMFMVLPNFLPKQKIVLGLDLQGGSHLLLQVNRDDIVEGRIGDIRREARAILIGENIGSIITTQGATLEVELTDPSQLNAAREALRPL